MDFDIWYYEQQTDIGYSEMKKAFEAGQRSKQAEIDRIVSIIAEAYKSDGNSSVEIVYDKIQELLK